MPEEKSSSIGTMIVVAIAAGLIGYVIGKPAPPQVQAKASDTSEKSTEPKEPAFVKEGLVAYYPFNGNAKDESGNGNDGKEVNGPALVKDRFGVANSAYSFDGKDDRIETPQKGFPKGESERTTSIWFRLPAKGNKFGVLWGAGAAAPQKLVAIQIRQGIDGPAVLCTDSYAKSIMIKKATLNDSVWHNVIWVLTKGNAKTYLDGEVVEVRPFPVNTNNYYFSNIGGSHVSDQTLLGEIDDIRIYNRALSEAEVKALYDLEKPKGK